MTRRRKGPSRTVYALRSVANGRMYVGLTVNTARRYKDHLNTLRRGSHNNRLLQADWDSGVCHSGLDLVILQSPAGMFDEWAWVDRLLAANIDLYNIDLTPRGKTKMTPAGRERQRLSLLKPPVLPTLSQPAERPATPPAPPEPGW